MRCWENLCALQKARGGKPLEDTRMRVHTASSTNVAQALYQQVLHWWWPVLIHQITEHFVSGCRHCQFALTHWVWQCVHIAWANHTDSVASSCAQRVCVEAGNRRESRWTWGSIRGIISVDNRVVCLIFSVTGFDSVQVGNNSRGTGFEHLYKVHLSLNIASMHHVTPRACFCLLKTQIGKYNYIIKKISKNLNTSLYKTLFKSLQ